MAENNAHKRCDGENSDPRPGGRRHSTGEQDLATDKKLHFDGGVLQDVLPSVGPDEARPALSGELL
jgi:hypothetical protein